MALTLAVGFLVDDAIVFLENTVSRLEHGEAPLEAAIHSAKQISFTILSMTISLAVVFLPLVFMPGLVGRIFREFAITIIVAIFASGIVSLTLTPMMCSRMLATRGKGHRKTLDGAKRLRRHRPRSGRLRKFPHLVPPPSLDLARHLVRHPRRHHLALHQHPQIIPPHRRQRLRHGCHDRQAGLIPAADAPIPGSGRRHHPRRSLGKRQFHADRPLPISSPQ